MYWIRRLNISLVAGVGFFYQYDENSAFRTYYGTKLFKDERLVEPIDNFNDTYAKMYVAKESDKENK